MKYILTIVFFSLFFLGTANGQSITKEELQIGAFVNSKLDRVINYDKNFMSYDRLFYESLDIIQKLSETELVEKTLKKYIEGSSYNKLELLKSAFTKDATLYLTGRDGFKLYTPKEYAAFFKGNTEGDFNGRYGKILAIEVVKDIATAKVEISIPKRKMLYIDLFLLKKFENGWKIISKTATRIDDTENK